MIMYLYIMYLFICYNQILYNIIQNIIIQYKYPSLVSKQQNEQITNTFAQTKIYPLIYLLQLIHFIEQIKYHHHQQTHTQIEKQMLNNIIKQISQYDPSAINTVSLNINNINKYSSIYTILISICILVTTIYINYNNISQIWKPISQLQVTQYQQKHTNIHNNKQFSNMPICISYNKSQQSTLNLNITAYLYTQINNNTNNNNNNNNNYTIDIIPALINMNNYQYIQMYMNNINHNYICYNLQGYTLTNNNQIRIQSYIPQLTQLTVPYIYIHIGTYTLDTIFNQQYPSINKLIQIQIQNITNKIISIQMATNQYIIYDKLLVNYQPSIIYTLNTNQLSIYQSQSYVQQQQLNITQFRLTLPKQHPIKQPNYLPLLHNSYTITRKNISTILSNLITYHNILIIILSLILSIFNLPQQYYKFDLIKQRIDSTVINKMQYSLLVQIKRRLSHYFPYRFFRERVLHKAMEVIQDQLDVIRILQISNMVSRQTIQYGQVQIQNQYNISQQQYNNTHIDMLLLSAQPQQPQQQQQQQQQQQTQYQILYKKDIKQNKTNGIIKVLKQIIYYFDNGVPIQIQKQKHTSYGSIWSILSCVIILFILITALGILGTFKMQQIYDRITMYGLDQQQLTVSIPSYSILVRTSNKKYKIQNKIYIVNQYDDIIQQVSFISDQKCIQISNTFNKNETDWYCNAQNIKLSSFSGKTRKLKIIPAYHPQIQQKQKTQDYTQIVLILPNTNSSQFDYTQHYIINHGYQQTNFIFRKNINIKNTIKQQNYQIQQTLHKISHQTVIYCTCSQKYNQITTKSTTYFDIYINCWPIALIVFNILLFPIGKFINRQVTSYNQSQQQNYNIRRNNLLNILYSIDRIANGIYKQELSQIDFYYKSRLNI